MIIVEKLISLKSQTAQIKRDISYKVYLVIASHFDHARVCMFNRSPVEVSWNLMNSLEFIDFNKLRSNFSWKLQQYQRDHDKISDIPPVCAIMCQHHLKHIFSLLCLQVSPLLSEHNIVI